MKIHPPTHGPRKNRWCGPSALSIITGKLTDHTADTIRRVSGRRNITGCHHWEVLAALREYGYRHQQVYLCDIGLDVAHGAPRPTLSAILKALPRQEGRVYLIVAGHHYQVVSGRRYACGRIGDVVSVRDPRVKRRARVARIWEISKL